MKTPKLILFSIFLLIAYIGFQSFNNFNSNTYHNIALFKSGGLAAAFGDDGTGGPLSNVDCIDCHGGGSYSPTIEINLFDSNTNLVSSYIPEDTYTVQLVVAATSGSPAGYGVQGVALTSTNQQAGNFNSPITPNSQIVNLSGRQYIEQNEYNVAGVFEFEWVAPVIGTGDVKVYAAGLAVNGASGTNGDSATSSIMKTISENILSIADLKFKDNLKIYPNPSAGTVNIKLGTYFEKVDLNVSNFIGQTILKKTFENTNILSFSMNDKKGVYFANLINERGERANIRFIIM